ncbi:hypothetical protein ACEV9J_24285, partial [Vibrio parahaemolyticus]
LSNGAKIGFIVVRDKNNNISKDNELRWAKEVHNRNGIVIVKLSSKFIERQLSKSRNPQKHDDINKELSKLISQYSCMWLNTKRK